MSSKYLSVNQSITKLHIKICCIQSEAEAGLAIRCGATALGFVSAMPSGFGPIPEAEICRIVRIVPPGIGTFLLTSLTDTEAIVEQHRRCRTNTIQLVDRLERGTHTDLREALAGITIVQVVHVRGGQSVKEAEHIAALVDALLLDSGDQTLPVKELGGTGRVHDWSISRTIRQNVNVPVFLAGGLTPTNVREAVEIVHPYGVDVCTGVRTNGVLDEEKLQAFVHQAQGI
jgi:phosphoribosylanthranilate isomerase